MNTQENFNIDYLVSNHDAFNDLVYTNLSQATKDLISRRDSLYIDNYIKNTLPMNVPDILQNKFHAFLSRDVPTPNHEMIRFIDIVKNTEILSPLFWEYSGDRFTPNVNESKYNLAKLTLYEGLDSKGNEKKRSISIVDFNKFNGKKISEINTLWGQSLVEFHHEFLEETILKNTSMSIDYFDATDWYMKSNSTVEVYYKYILILFLKHGILFENFVLADLSEQSFVRRVFLPAFLEIYKETGLKPLIVPLEPIETEKSKFTYYYPHRFLGFIKSKIN